MDFKNNRNRRRYSDSYAIPKNKRGHERHWSISPPSIDYFSLNDTVKINNDIWTKVNTIRVFKKIYYILPKLIIKTFYSNINYSSSIMNKKGINYFRDTISKSIFDFISRGIDVFNYDNNLLYSDFIRQLDIDLFDDLCIGRTIPINHELIDGESVAPDVFKTIKHSLLDLDLNIKIYNMEIINKCYYLKVYKKTLNSGVSFIERKDQVIITHKQYRRLSQRYNHDESLFNKLVFLLIYRYKSIGNNNAHCSLPPKLIDNYKLTELFGSPLNTISENYYSPFKEEKYFGSRGNFFTSKIPSGNYLANPPYDIKLVQKMITRLIECLTNTPEITIIINIPSIYNLDEDLTKNRFYKDEKSLFKDQYKHYDYYSDSYIPVCSTKVILLSNKINEKINLNSFCKEWEKQC